MSHSPGYETSPVAGGPGYAPGAGATPPAEEKAATNSLGDLVKDVAGDLSTLVRQELELAKAEARETATRAGKGAGMYGGAGIAGHFVLLFLSLALWWALGYYLVGLGWSAVIVAVLWGIVAAILAVRAKKELQAAKGLPRTAETVKKIPESLKPSEEPR